MSDLRTPEMENEGSRAASLELARDARFDFQLRHKPGPKPKEFPRSQKESCRLTVEEATAFRLACKKRRVRPADYLRECCLAAAYIRKSVDKTSMLADVFIRLHELEATVGQDHPQATASPNELARTSKISSHIVIIRKKLKAVLYAGLLVLAWSAGNVQAAKSNNMFDLIEVLKNNLLATLISALFFAFLLGILAEKASSAGHFSVRQIIARLRCRRK